MFAQLKLSNLLSKIQLRLNDAALTVEVNVSALDLPPSPDAHVHTCLQEHITKLQVRWGHVVGYLFSLCQSDIVEM